MWCPVDDWMFWKKLKIRGIHFIGVKYDIMYMSNKLIILTWTSLAEINIPHGLIRQTIRSSGMFPVELCSGDGEDSQEFFIEMGCKTSLDELKTILKGLGFSYQEVKKAKIILIEPKFNKKSKKFQKINKIIKQIKLEEYKNEKNNK